MPTNEMPTCYHCGSPAGQPCTPGCGLDETQIMRENEAEMEEAFGPDDE